MQHSPEGAPDDSSQYVPPDAFYEEAVLKKIAQGDSEYLKDGDVTRITLEAHDQAYDALDTMYFNLGIDLKEAMGAFGTTSVDTARSAYDILKEHHISPTTYKELWDTLGTNDPTVLNGVLEIMYEYERNASEIKPYLDKHYTYGVSFDAVLDAIRDEIEREYGRPLKKAA